MMQLDIATLTLTFASLGLTTLLVLFLIWRINRDMPGVQCWMVGAALSLTSSFSLFLSIQLGLPEGMAPFISNSLSLPGNMLLMEGTLRFRGYASRRRWLFLLSLIPVFILASWLNRFDAAARYIVHDSFTLAFLIVTAIAFVWRPDSREELYANSLAAFGSALMGLTIGSRWFLALTGNEQMMAGTGSVATQWYLFTATNFYIMWIFGISVACYFRSRQQVMQLAREDSLTGLPNRRCIDERIAQAINETRRSGQSFAVILLDVNNFKQVNDQLGHSAGDRLLVCIASRLLTVLRESDFAGRLGGDEFIVLAHPAESDEAVIGLIARLRQALEGPLDLPGSSFEIRISIGAAISPCDGDSADQLLGAADTRMYQNKAQART